MLLFCRNILYKIKTMQKTNRLNKSFLFSLFLKCLNKIILYLYDSVFVVFSEF